MNGLKTQWISSMQSATKWRNFHAKRDQVAKLPYKARPSGETSMQSATKWRNFHAKRDQVAKLPYKARPSGETSDGSIALLGSKV